MGKSLWILSIILILVLIIGGYFLFKKVGSNDVSNLDLKENAVDCKMGESRITPIPEGVTAGGQITGVEKYSFVNGESLNLCCSDASTLQGDLNYKSCSLAKNNVITHEILWKKVGNNLIKVKEVEPFNPQSESICTYYFKSDGTIESRSCS